MARARNLKPGFFTNDRLGEMEPLARLLFQGMWCHADREGRLENRPKKLKAEILPYDDCDVPNLLLQLTASGFVVCYGVGNAQYIEIVNFAKHQKPHPKEPASAIPAAASRDITRRDHDEPRKETATQETAMEGMALPSLPSSSLIPHPSSRTEAYASAPAAPAVRPLDLKKAFWETGKAFLEANGVPHHRSGGLLGKWRRDFGEPAVVAAMARAEAECPSELVEFIEGCLRAQNGKRSHNGQQSPHDTLLAGFGKAVARVKAGGG